MLVLLLQAPPALAWPTIGLSPQELQAIIGRKMPITHKVGQIDSPEVNLDAQQQTVEVCSKWQVWRRAALVMCADQASLCGTRRPARSDCRPRV
jgi:hypothetical protein